MRRILIVNNNMHIGGVQKALLNLLNEIRTDYDVTLLLFYKGGELLNEIPAEIKVVTPAAPFLYWGMAGHDAKSPWERLGRCFWAGVTRVFGRPFSIRIASLFQKRLRGFDVAVSFLHSGPDRMFYGGCNEFVLRRVEARRKVTFLHCDYGEIRAASKAHERIYRQFDAIAACSAGCRQAFLKVVPQFADKTVVVPNCQNYGTIKRMARETPVNLDRDRLNIVTVARFGREKGILRALRAVAELHAQRGRFRYYIIGDGAEYPEAKRILSELGLTDTVFLLGAMENPYGYMAAADVLLIPSVSEAAPMVIHEAACLGTPILTTETSSAVEMVEQTGFGWVCPNTQDGIRRGIEMLLENPRLIRETRRHLDNARFDNAEAVQNFSELVHGYDQINPV